MSRATPSNRMAASTRGTPVDVTTGVDSIARWQRGQTTYPGSLQPAQSEK